MATIILFLLMLIYATVYDGGRFLPLVIGGAIVYLIVELFEENEE